MNKYDCFKCKGTKYIEYGSPEGDFTETCNKCHGTGKRLITITLEEYDLLIAKNQAEA